MSRPRSNSLGDLRTHSTVSPEFSPAFLASRAATDLQSSGSNTLVSREPSSRRPRLGLDTSLPEDEQELPIARFDSVSSTQAQQERINPVNETEGEPPTDTLFDPPMDGPWGRKNVLTCDGGGIRGYASLLMIEALMIEIGRIERDHVEPRHNSSFAPCPRQPALKTRKSGFRDVEGALVSDYLPCHYFDYMIGTSTGGLIAIMLSRWRMSVAECLHQYEAVGPKVFGKPRTISIVGFPHDKYHKAPLVNVIKQLTEEKTPETCQGDGDQFRLFPAPSELCRCAVVANAESRDRRVVGTHLFRTYEVDLPLDTPTDLEAQPRNWMVPAKHEIWEVCRATTAAPTYFRPAIIDNKVYSDGGVGNNNPAMEAFDEIDRLHKNCLENLASFGTGKPVKYTDAEKKFRLVPLFQLASRLLKTATAGLTDCEKTHKNLQRHARTAKGTSKEFNYFRFNIEEGLGKVPLDEWKEKRDRTAPGGKFTTFDKLRQHTQVELEKEKVKTRLHDLALLLVHRRRERAKDELGLGYWERFACCTTYRCPDERCRVGGKDRSFNLRGEMREHLDLRHPKLEYRNMTPIDIEADFKVRLDQYRHGPEFPSGPY